MGVLLTAREGRLALLLEGGDPVLVVVGARRAALRRSLGGEHLPARTGAVGMLRTIRFELEERRRWDRVRSTRAISRVRRSEVRARRRCG